jgi:hypothetical protein
MARTTLISFAALVSLAMMLAACEGGGQDEGDDGGPGLRGRLVDANEQPLPDVEVLACQATTCYYGESDADGRFSFVIEPPAELALKTHTNLAAVPRVAAALVPVDIIDDVLVDLGDVYVPALPEGVVLGVPSEELQTYLVGDGLELSLRSADLMPSIGEFLYDMAASRVPPEHVPPYDELEGEQVLAVYAMHPFAATCTSVIGVRVPVDAPEGTQVWLRTLSHVDGNVVEVIAGVVENGHAVTAPGIGITRLTHLIVSM